jgi:hypothetical protein
MYSLRRAAHSSASLLKQLLCSFWFNFSLARTVGHILDKGDFGMRLGSTERGEKEQNQQDKCSTKYCRIRNDSDEGGVEHPGK